MGSDTRTGSIPVAGSTTKTAVTLADKACVAAVFYCAATILRDGSGSHIFQGLPQTKHSRHRQEHGKRTAISKAYEAAGTYAPYSGALRGAAS